MVELYRWLLLVSVYAVFVFRKSNYDTQSSLLLRSYNFELSNDESEVEMTRGPPPYPYGPY